MTFSCPIWPPNGPEIAQALEESLQSGQWGSYRSRAHEELTIQIARIAGRRHARLVGSGTAAIELALRAAGVSAADEVIVSALDYPGNLRCVEAVGARPVLADILPASAALDPNSVANAGTPKTKAVIASHLYTSLTPIDALESICRDNSWILIEDACQVVGGWAAGKPAGSWGDVSTFSFGGTKPLTAGNGGAIVFDDERVRAKLASLIERPSDTQPLSALQSAVLLPQIQSLPANNLLKLRCAEAIAKAAERWPTWSILFEIGRGDVEDEPLAASHLPTFYKLAVQAQDSRQRDRCVAIGKECSVPVGQTFRSMHRTSSRRCGKPVELTKSEHFADTCFVISHHALMLEQASHAGLITVLDKMHTGSVE